LYVYENSGTPETRGPAFEPSQRYEYRLDDAAAIPEMVRQGAGAGKL
jgi:pectate lyase